ncbi:MAG: Fructose-like protein permease IIC component 1, partial [Escherichia coli DORA_A_5_14_21]
VILAFSQLIAYSWLKIPADIGIMDALNRGKFSGFDLSLLKFAWLSQSFGGVLFGFAIPMFAAFVANSIGGKLAFPGWFYRRVDVYPADATAELRSQHDAMGDLFAGAVHLHWCPDYFYRCWLPCEVDEPENPVTGFPVSVQ